MTSRWSAGAAVTLAVLVGYWGRSPAGVAFVPVGGALVAAVLMAVHHAETIAHRIGEPFGTLVLAISVTAIEVGLIVALTAGGGDGASTLARDTVFAAVMIVTNLVIGLSVVVGVLAHRVLRFSSDATTGLLATLTALAALTLVLPSFTTSTPGNTYSDTQLGFAAVSALGLYGVFVLVQTVLDRAVFVADIEPDPTGHGAEPEMPLTASGALLLACLVAVVGLAKTSSSAIDDVVEALGATQQLEGVILALLVLLPETIAAVKAARRDELQTSLNLALGSGIASIGLTIPAVALASIWVDTPLVLGLQAKELVLLTLTIIVAGFTLGQGRVTLLNGAIHLVLMLVFLFLAVEP